VTPAEGDFDVQALLDDGDYVQTARTLVIDQQEGAGKQVVLILGDAYTMWSVGTFRAWAAHLLAELQTEDP
jgi:hypothetical protein